MIQPRALIFSLFSLAAFLFSLRASADCGLPPRSVRYSENFYKAQARLFQQAQNEATSASVLAPEIPLLIGANQARSTDTSNYQSLSLQTARSFVQDEIRDHGAAIIAECGYQLCQLGQQTNEASFATVEALGSLCRLALGDAGSDVGALAAFPSYRAVIFRSDEKSRVIRARLVNKTPGTLEISTPVILDPEKGELESALALYLGKEKVIKIGPHQTAGVKFLVRKPAESDGIIKTDPMIFVVKGGKDSSAEFRFSLIPSFDLLLPSPTISCGRVNPHARVKCTSDSRGQFPDKTAGHDDWANVPVSGGPVVDYSSNGRTWGFANYQATCNPTSPTQSSASISFGFDASVGGVCGRNGTNAGGEGGVMPEWESSLSLPGNPAKQRWQLSLAVEGSRPGNGNCSMNVNGESIPVGFSGATTKTVEVEPGEYSVRLACQGENPWRGCYGANEGTRAESPFKLFATVKVKRTTVSSSP